MPVCSLVRCTMQPAPQGVPSVIAKPAWQRAVRFYEGKHPIDFAALGRGYRSLINTCTTLRVGGGVLRNPRLPCQSPITLLITTVLFLLSMETFFSHSQDNIQISTCCRDLDHTCCVLR